MRPSPGRWSALPSDSQAEMFAAALSRSAVGALICASIQELRPRHAGAPAPPSLSDARSSQPLQIGEIWNEVLRPAVRGSEVGGQPSFGVCSCPGRMGSPQAMSRDWCREAPRRIVTRPSAFDESVEGRAESVNPQPPSRGSDPLSSQGRRPAAPGRVRGRVRVSARKPSTEGSFKPIRSASTSNPDAKS